MILLATLFCYLVAVNAAAYGAFALDKQRAIHKQPRTPEATLLFWARIGGWGGAKYAQQKLRHKSHKQPFGRQLNIIGMVQSAVAVTFAVVLGALAVSNADPEAPPVTASNIAPAAAPVAISLRPPAGRPATW